MNHPRPQFARERYIPLDGTWNLTVTEDEGHEPVLSSLLSGGTASKRTILMDNTPIQVPYPPEAPLSGIGKHFPEGSRLWYTRRFEAPAMKEGEHLLLHIDGVDQKARVFLNGKELDTVCTVLNGPAALDITKWLKPENSLILCCTDDLRDRRFPYGK